MADADRIRPTRLLVLVGLLGLIFLLLLVLVAVRFGPEVAGTVRVAPGVGTGEIAVAARGVTPVARP